VNIMLLDLDLSFAKCILVSLYGVLLLDGPAEPVRLLPFVFEYCLNACTFLQRITAAQIHKNEWFKKGYTPAKFDKDVNINLDDIDAVFSESNVRLSNLYVVCIHVSFIGYLR